MIIVLQGPDTYRSSRRMRQLRQAFIEKYDQRQLAVATIDGATATAEMIMSALGSGGLFSSKRFLLVDDLTPSSPCWSHSAFPTALGALKNDADRIVVLRYVPSAPKKGRTPKEKTTKIPGAKTEEFPLLSETETRAWIKKELTERKGTITRDAEEMLMTRTKQNLWQLDQELEKLLAAGNGAITVELVQSLVAGDVRSDIFALTDALGQRQRNRALHVVTTEFSAGTHPLILVSALLRHVQALWHVRSALDQGKTPNPAELDLHPFVVKKATAQARSLTRDDLRSWHHALLEIEKDLKTSPLDAETLVDRFIMRVPS